MILYLSFCVLCNAAPNPYSTVRVVAVLENWIVVDIPTTISSDINRLKVTFTEVSKRQTKEPITFTVKKPGPPWLSLIHI